MQKFKPGDVVIFKANSEWVRLGVILGEVMHLAHKNKYESFYKVNLLVCTRPDRFKSGYEAMVSDEYIDHV